MTYASNTRRPNPAALAGALGIPAAVGALMVVGLAVTVVTAPPEPRLKGFTVRPIPIPPPPPDPVEPATSTAKTATASTRTAVTQPTGMLPVDLGRSDPVGTLPGTGDLIGPVTGPVDFGIQPAHQSGPLGDRPRLSPALDA